MIYLSTQAYRCTERQSQLMIDSHNGRQSKQTDRQDTSNTVADRHVTDGQHHRLDKEAGDARRRSSYVSTSPSPRWRDPVADGS